MWGVPSTVRRTHLSYKPIIVVLVCWELAARVMLINPVFFPPPIVIASTAINLLLFDDMLTHLGVSLQRVFFAFILGGTTGVVVGLVMGWSKDIRDVLNPYISLLYPIPKIVLLPIMFSLFGFTETARVLTISLAMFLLVAMNTMGGVREIDDVHFNIARDNGAGTVALFRDVIVPGALPQIFSGLSLGFGLGFILIVVIEIVAADAGLGYVIWNSWNMFTIPRLYVALLLINVIGIVFLYGIEALGAHLTPWQQETGATPA